LPLACRLVFAQSAKAGLSQKSVLSVLVLSLSCGFTNTRACGQGMEAVLPDAPGYASAAAVTPSEATHNAPVTLRGLPLRFLKDEAAIVRSPARIDTGDLKWLLPLAGATGASLGTDTYTMRHVVSRSPGFNGASAKGSDVLLGAALGVPVLLFGIGHVRADEHERETGLLASEAILDAYVFDTGVKYATLRERPNQNDARGHFFVGAASSSPSFVSGHSIMAWSSAAVLASEYNKPWQQVGIYTLASGVSLTRVLAQEHFPTDALLGSAAGWLIGRYVYHAHHRSGS
jgi:hypothetical protein